MTYIPPTVSRYFKFDWQFAVDRSKLPFLRPASIIIALMPLLLHMSVTLYGIRIISVPLALWMWWFASVSFLISWSILQFCCPNLILQYRDYGEYSKHQHSHRWIVWLFYNTIKELTGWQTIVQETLEKGLSVRVTDQKTSDEYRQCPYTVRENAKSTFVTFNCLPDSETVQIFHPVNLDRDLYVPIHCYGQKLLLLLQEDDPKLKQKEKELFWILYSQAAKERPRCRFSFWFFYYLSLAFIAFNVLKNVYLVVVGEL